MSILRIHILHHENSSHRRLRQTMICHLARRWEKEGHTVNHIFGLRYRRSADVLILHVDLSCIPEEYIEFANRYPRVLNMGLHDIRKRTISKNLIDRGSPYDGPVIVKTDLNHGGAPERLLGILPRRRLVSVIRSFKKHLNIESPISIRNPSDYMIYRHKSDVPGSVFCNEDFVVEKFQPERHGNEYYQRRYFFLGHAEYNEIHATSVPIHAGDSDGHCNRYWEEVCIPLELRRYRKTLKADYGKIDYVIKSGRIVVFDVNRTPSSGNIRTDPIARIWTQRIVDRLHTGIGINGSSHG